MTRPPINELAAALAAFQAEVPVIPKKQTAKIQTERGRDYSYSYAGLGDIAPVVMPLLAKHGLAFTALPTARKDTAPVLVGLLMHTSGQSVSGELPITGRTPQEIGSSLTYGRRYLLGCLTGVVTDDDDDGALSERAAKRTRKTTTENVPLPPVAPPIQRRQPPPEDKAVENAARDAQRRALFAAVGKALPEAQRAERLALCSAVIGRRIESSTELTMPEASKVLAWVDEYVAGREIWQFNADTGTGYTFPVDESEPA